MVEPSRLILKRCPPTSILILRASSCIELVEYFVRVETIEEARLCLVEPKTSSSRIQEGVGGKAKASCIVDIVVVAKGGTWSADSSDNCSSDNCSSKAGSGRLLLFTVRPEMAFLSRNISISVSPSLSQPSGRLGEQKVSKTAKWQAQQSNLIKLLYHYNSHTLHKEWREGDVGGLGNKWHCRLRQKHLLIKC